jgi:hypothetical protein
MKLITIDDKSYALDLKKISSYLFKGDWPKEINITEIFDGDSKLEKKQVTETKVSGGNRADTEENIKYNVIQMMLTVLFESETTDSTEIDFGTSICFNTMIAEGFLYEVVE